MNLKIRVSFTGYRDYGDSEQYSIKNFNENIEEVKIFISQLRAFGSGGDLSEDVCGGLH